MKLKPSITEKNKEERREQLLAVVADFMGGKVRRSGSGRQNRSQTRPVMEIEPL